jgi:hypothetical protein
MMHMVTRIFKTGFILTLIAVLLTSVIATVMPTNASALSGGQFNAGRIIDDSVFYNGGTMSWQSIQAFLNSKVPNCDTNGTQQSGHGSYTRAQWGSMNGAPAPFTCLKDYFQGVPTKGPDAYCGGTINGGTKNAAQIIYDVGAACNVNPQALIVLLQKEQSLITDDWPWPIQYRSATGYGCPDTAPCDAEYYGFFNQVYNAARQFQRYRIQGHLFNYRAFTTSYVQYNPNGGCGGTNLYIQNSATAALYNYTPYQPNAAALNNLYGTGDGCSAYGNRNFWRMFNDWFGSTTGDPAQYAGQTANPSLFEGQQASVSIMYRNTSSSNWFDTTKAAANNSHPVNLAVGNPINSQSPFSWTWPNMARPATEFSAVYEADGVTPTDDQHAARPNQIVKYTFTVTVPYSYPAGVHKLYVQPVLEGAGNWNMGGLAWIDVNVNPRYFTAQYAGQAQNPTLKAGGVASMFYRYRNIGNVNWYDDVHAAGNNELPVHLATTNPINNGSMFSWGWPSVNRPANTFSAVYKADGVTLADNQHIAQPGEIAQFSFNMSTPWDARPGDYTTYFQPIRDGAPHWDMGSGLGWSTVSVQPDIRSAQYAGQSGYPTLAPGQAAASFLQYKNAGNVNWYDTSNAAANGTTPVRLATTNPINAASSFSWGWPSVNRTSDNFSAVYEADGVTLASNQHIVEPGQIARWNFNLTAPYGWATRNNTVYFQPVWEGDRWNMGGTAWFDITVQ